MPRGGPLTLDDRGVPIDADDVPVPPLSAPRVAGICAHAEGTRTRLAPEPLSTPSQTRLDAGLARPDPAPSVEKALAGPVPGSAASCRLLRGAEGVTTGGLRRSADDTAAARAAISAEGVSAEERWGKHAACGEWDRVLMPLACYRFGAPVTEDPRAGPAHKDAVLKELGLADPGSSDFQHLSSADFAVLVEVLRRKAAAFWVDPGPRTTRRAFMHDVVVDGPPVRSHPIRLRGTDANFVAEGLDQEVRDGTASMCGVPPPGAAGPSLPSRVQAADVSGLWSTTVGSTRGLCDP